ncbi:uncharacterized protein [Montipora capricornis]|uniref:uncharacterized protein isoform X2 n=1 Tax=Montipora capricornis TaxID=246305 RepID=UPI0035F15919
MPNKTANKDLTSSIEDVLEAGDAIHLHTVTGVEIGNADFLGSIAVPVMTQPQTFTDNMFDTTSKEVMNGIATVHLTGERLQQKLRQKANELQKTFFKNNDDQGNSMSYKDLLAGLIYEGETFQSLNNFAFMNYTHLRFCDESGNALSQRSGGICLQTDKRLLLLSAQYTIVFLLPRLQDVAAMDSSS